MTDHGHGNTWPDGRRRAMSQGEHERWNANHYPGTRQLCALCSEPTGRCEEDSLHADDGSGPLCRQCHEANRDKS